MSPPFYPSGIHLLADFHGVDAKRLICAEEIDTLLQGAAREAGAHVLHSHFHSFGKAQGVTGVVMLAESHISIHTWPEAGFAAADIFMCGDAKPEVALDVIERALRPEARMVRRIERGLDDEPFSR